MANHQSLKEEFHQASLPGDITRLMASSVGYTEEKIRGLVVRYEEMGGWLGNNSFVDSADFEEPITKISPDQAPHLFLTVIPNSC